MAHADPTEDATRPLTAIRRAVIDVGTNSVKLLVADVRGREIRPITEHSKQTRLGQGFYETHRLRAQAIEATAAAVAAFAATARDQGASSVRVIATSAAREAVNREELTGAIEHAAGLKVEVISGDQEAELGFQGVTTDTQLAQGPLLLMDVGGGSAQFVYGCDGHLQFRQSFPLGTVRLLERIRCSDPPTATERAACLEWVMKFLADEVQPKLTAAWRKSTGSELPAPVFVGVGGTATILGCMEAELTEFDRSRLEATRLTAARLSWNLDRLWRLPLEQRRQIVGLPANRADVILMGATIYHSVMQTFGFPTLRISTRGLRFAALLSAPA